MTVFITKILATIIKDLGDFAVVCKSEVGF